MAIGIVGHNKGGVWGTRTLLWLEVMVGTLVKHDTEHDVLGHSDWCLLCF